MTKKSLIILIALLVTSIGFAQGTVNWNGWSFDWSLGTDASGLVLKNVTKDNKKIMDKASFPVMRVQYDGDVCGPYADILTSNTFRAGPISAADPGTPSAECNGQRVCQRSFVQNGESKLELGANSQIGEYQIYQVYYFGEDTIESRVYSRGLQCRIDHVHHAHWLFDFDIGDAENDQVFVNGNQLVTTERNEVRSSQYWDIKDAVTGDSVSLIPSPDDGVRDSFSSVDAAIRKYNSGETGRWTAGARGEIGNLFNNGENINGQDIVFWYVTHLRHLASEGERIWHASGPTIRVNSSSSPNPDPNPNPNPDGNLLQNAGFDSSTNWSNCGNGGAYNISSSNLNLSSGACVFQNVPATAGQTYSLSCNGRITSNSWSSVTLSMLNANYSSLSQEVVQNTNTSLQTLSTSLQAPNGTVYVAATFYSEGNANYSDCRLEISGSNPDPTPDPPPSGNTSLQNAGFDASEGWTNCGNSNTYNISGSRLNVNSGACVFQTVSVVPGATYTLSCTGNTSANTWNTFILSMLDSNWQAIVQDFEPINTSSSINSISLQAPSNASYVAVSFYSEGSANYSGCNLSSSSSPTNPPANTTLLNPSFDGSQGWNNCGNASSYYISGGNLNLNSGVCLFQTISATPGGRYTLTCQGNTNGNIWSTFTLSMLDSNWQSLSQSFKPVSTSNSTQSITLTAPSNAAHVAVSFYSEGSATYQGCSLSRATSLEAGSGPQLSIQSNSDGPEQLELIPLIDFSPKL